MSECALPDGYPNEPAVTFYELYSRGDVDSDDLTEFAWFWFFEYPGTLDLHEYLGLTRNQCRYWSAHGVIVSTAIADWWQAQREADEERAMREERAHRARKRRRWLLWP